MSINRNDPCPCGSGKKYKKCCLNKKSVIEFQEVKEEKFYQQKHALVGKMKSFFEDKIPFHQYLQLQTEFLQRSGNKTPSEMREGYIQFWLYFCHRFENNLRGIEWFYQEQATRRKIG